MSLQNEEDSLLSIQCSSLTGVTMAHCKDYNYFLYFADWNSLTHSLLW